MSTQHPDNVNSPFFAQSSELGGEDEIQEAYYAFSHLGCDEQMWDCEGKEVDSFVVKKLLSKYGTFFQEKKLGTDCFITLRVPNPTVEKTEAKILLETLESIPRSFDAARHFYNSETPPIFEVILPMTASYRCMNRVYTYYRDFVVGKQHRPFRQGDITIAEWIGDFRPDHIDVIPLFEDREHMLDAHNVVGDYLKDKQLEYQRVFLARSDPAMNYGLISAVLLNKIALQRLHGLSQSAGVDIHPIVGVGSAPFRGSLRPETVERVGKEYPSASTFTIQSAFKYDHQPNEVRNAIMQLRERTPGLPQEVDEQRCLALIDKYCHAYQEQVVSLAGIINAAARFIPSRRKRKLHIGLFGYPRSVEGVALPRVITFTAALYSLGVPPELLGLNALDRDDLRFLKHVYVNFEEDMRDSLRYYNADSPFLPANIRKAVDDLGIDFESDEQHRRVSGQVATAIRENQTGGLTENVLRMANLRRFLG